MSTSPNKQPSMSTSTTSSASPLGPGQTLSAAELEKLQHDYSSLRYKVALGMLVVAPAIIALPPRKMDAFTFGLGFMWVYCLNEVTKQHGSDLLHVITRTPKPDPNDPNYKPLQGWKGDSVYAQYREREEDGMGIKEMIMESVWDVWQQRDKRKLTPEQEEEEELPLAERVKKYEKEMRERKEREAVEALTKK